MENLKISSDALFILLGAVMVLAMHAGFAFLELGTVRKKNQVNALVKILVDFSVSTIAYFFIGYTIAYGVNFFSAADKLAADSGYQLVKFFFLLTFAAAIPAIVSGGIAERAKFSTQLAATFLLVGFIYPFFEGISWNSNYGIQRWLETTFGAPFHDFAGSIVVHAVGGWIGLVAVAPAGRAPGPLQQRGRRCRPPAVEHSLSCAGSVDSHGRLVWLQCHVGPDHRQDQRPGGGQFADGHGRRNHWCIDRRSQRPRLCP